MARSVASFKRKGIEVIPAPAGYIVRYSKYHLKSFPPLVGVI